MTSGVVQKPVAVDPRGSGVGLVRLGPGRRASREDVGSKVVNLSGLPVLDANDQRIVGALLEKQMTVPASCPLTAIALRATSHNRDPVLDLDLPTVEQVAR